MIQSNESERNAQRNLQVMGMNLSFDLITDMPELDLDRLTRLEQLNGCNAIFMDTITTLLGRFDDGGRGIWSADLRTQRLVRSKQRSGADDTPPA